jgi:hypothetical protein
MSTGNVWPSQGPWQSVATSIRYDDSISHPSPRFVSIAQAIRDAGFKVFVPTYLPEGVRILARFLWHDTLWMVSDDGGRPPVKVNVWQKLLHGEPDKFLRDVSGRRWQRREVQGQPLEVCVEPSDETSGRVRIMREGTLIEIAGTPPLSELCDVLLSMAPADIGPLQLHRRLPGSEPRT